MASELGLHCLPRSECPNTHAAILVFVILLILSKSINYVSDCAEAYYQQDYHRKQRIFIQPHPDIHRFLVTCNLYDGPVTRILSRAVNYTDEFENKMWWHYK